MMEVIRPCPLAMSEEQLKAFLEAVKADAGLQEKLKAAGDANAVVAIAKAAGFVISVELVKAERQLSDEELEGVAGGTIVTWLVACVSDACKNPVTIMGDEEHGWNLCIM